MPRLRARSGSRFGLWNAFLVDIQVTAEEHHFAAYVAFLRRVIQGIGQSPTHLIHGANLIHVVVRDDPTPCEFLRLQQLSDGQVILVQVEISVKPTAFYIVGRVKVDQRCSGKDCSGLIKTDSPIGC